jgi:hypothetical protein
MSLLQKLAKAIQAGESRVSFNVNDITSNSSRRSSPCALPAALHNSALEQLLTAKCKHITQVGYTAVTVCLISAKFA